MRRLIAIATATTLAGACGADPVDARDVIDVAGDATGIDAEVSTCPATCPSSPAPCIPNVCRPEVGTCVASPLPVDTPCDRDADPTTPDVCDALGACVPDVPITPPPVACEAITPIACGAVAASADGLDDHMRRYDCGDPLPGGELVYTFTPAATGHVRVTIDAAPRDYLRVVVLEATCDTASCIGDIHTDLDLVLPVVAGRDYFVVIDATIGGVVELQSLRLECAGAERCDNGDDDDFDLQVDCADPDCFDAAPCEPTETRCDDRFDNDGDGDSDCADRDCDGLAGCEAATELTCTDLADNDDDGQADCADTDCWADAACLVACETISRPIGCGDLLDQVEADRQAFAAHACATGDWRVPELVYTFTPTSSGTAWVGLATQHAAARVILYDGGCAGTCAESVAVPPVDFAEPLSFGFTAGSSYMIVIDAAPIGDVVAHAVVLDRLRLRCE